MLFKGIPIDGTLDEMSNKLSSIGFLRVKISGEDYDYYDGSYCMKMNGEFMGKSNINVLIDGTKNKLPYCVIVTFNEEKTWESLYSSYSDIKKQSHLNMGNQLKQQKKKMIYLMII